MTWEKSGSFEQTAEFQQMYAQLLCECDKWGTMVMQDRFLENDKDIAPHRFFRKGTMEYIFPPQKVSLQSDTSKVITPQSGYPGFPDTAGYGLRTEVQRYNIDESKVKGRLRIEYQDAENRPELSVTEVLGDSELPQEVRKTLEDLF